ncbi:MAG: hypothetical protein IPI75_04125 [Gammaproteobacteria bacterium]|nr:hypothetical protein [Gammaproteobacteria bacterium]
MNKLVFDNIHDRHIGRAIRMQAEQNGDTRFLVFDRTVYTFDQANSRVNELAAGLQARHRARRPRGVLHVERTGSDVPGACGEQARCGLGSGQQ